MDKQAALQKGIQEFNNGEYFECHETLEEIWMTEVGPDRPFYQGLIQLSVGCFHLLNGNYLGAASQWEKGCAKLQSFEARHLGINVKSLLEQTRRCQEMLRLVQSGQMRKFDLSLISQMRIECDW